jgi:septal ring-binding cell division protein DamX/type II secretory pathway predicted ATPase ExeA
LNTAAHTPTSANDYLATLGLQQHPYLDPTDARFFYADPGLIQRLDLLQHLTQFGDMLLGVTGAVGSGKSTLAQQFFLRSSSASWRSCHLNGTQLQEPAELLAKLAEGFGLHATVTAERLKADLVRHCQSLRQNAQLPVVVIDDAQLLPDSVLSDLLALADDDAFATLKLLRIILFSEPGFEQRLVAMGLHSPSRPLLHCMDIPHFDAQQTAAYLMFRLAAAGYSGECPFSLTEIRALHKSTAGVPGKLNIQAHELLLEHAGRIALRKQVVTPSPRRTRPAVVLGLIGSLAAVALAWYLNQDRVVWESLARLASAPPWIPATDSKPAAERSQPTAKPKEESKVALESTPDKLQQDVIKRFITENPAITPALTIDSAILENATPPMDAIHNLAPALPALEAHPASVPPFIQPVADGTSDTQASGPTPLTATDLAPAPQAADNTAATKPVPSDTPDQPAETPPAEAPVGATKAQTPESGQTATTELPKKSQPPITTAPLATVTPPATPPAPAAEPSQPAADAVPAPAARTPAPKTTEQLGTEWLLSRAGSRFTLQLLGGRSEKSLREYLRRNRIPEPVATFRTTFKGSDWYGLVHGDFPTMAAAQATVDTLPANVRKAKPWARSFATVHEAMQQDRP